MIAVMAGWFPQRQFLVVAESAYIGKTCCGSGRRTCKRWGRLWKAALYEAESQPRRGCRHGRAWPRRRRCCRTTRRPAQRLRIEFKSGCQRLLDVKLLTGLCRNTAAGSAPVQVVLVRDPKGEWRDEALVCRQLLVRRGSHHGLLPVLERGGRFLRRQANVGFSRSAGLVRCVRAVRGADGLVCGDVGSRVVCVVGSGRGTGVPSPTVVQKQANANGGGHVGRLPAAAMAALVERVLSSCRL